MLHWFFIDVQIKKIIISINNDPIIGQDPFLENYLKIEKGKSSLISLKSGNEEELIDEAIELALTRGKKTSDDERE